MLKDLHLHSQAKQAVLLVHNYKNLVLIDSLQDQKQINFTKSDTLFFFLNFIVTFKISVPSII